MIQFHSPLLFLHIWWYLRTWCFSFSYSELCNNFKFHLFPFLMLKDFYQLNTFISMGRLCMTLKHDIPISINIISNTTVIVSFPLTVPWKQTIPSLHLLRLWFLSMWKHVTVLTEMLEHQEIITCLNILSKSQNTFHVVTCQLLRTVHCNISLSYPGLSLCVARGEGVRRGSF